MTLPARIKPEPMGREKRIRSPAHLKWVREHACVVDGCDGRPIEAAHVRLGAHAGMGQKPDDSVTVSMCTAHHAESHRVGERTFQERYRLDLLALAREFAERSPHKAKLARRGA